jgi:N-methylhydantoinase B
VTNDETGKRELACKARGDELAVGDLVILETGGGGGYGRVEDRQLAAIQRDLDEGYVTREAAARDYNVVVDANGRVSRPVLVGADA